MNGNWTGMSRSLLDGGKVGFWAAVSSGTEDGCDGGTKEGTGGEFEPRGARGRRERTRMCAAGNWLWVGPRLRLWAGFLTFVAGPLPL